MKRLKTLIFMFPVLLTSPLFSHSLASEHPDGPITGNPDWPKGLAELINQESRFYGYFINADDYFFFRGDTEEFNKFLKEYTELEGFPHILVIHPGRGIENRLGSEEKFEFDWELKALRWGWDAYVSEELKDEVDCLVILHVWLGSGIDLEEIEVPLHINLKSSREIEKFIEEHKFKQRESKGKPTENKPRRTGRR